MPLTKLHLRFKQIRATLGLNQVDFAAMAKITQSEISQIETGYRGISTKTFQKLTANLKVNRIWLADGVGDMFTDGRSVGIEPKQLIDNPSQKHNSPTKFGERFKFFRQQEKLSAEQLASELDITVSTLRKYENGRLMVPIAVVVYLHSKYRLHYDWFFDGDGNRKIKPVDRQSGAVDINDLYETQTVLVAKIDYLEKQLNQERTSRKKMQKDINDLSVKIA